MKKIMLLGSGELGKEFTIAAIVMVCYMNKLKRQHQEQLKVNS